MFLTRNKRTYLCYTWQWKQQCTYSSLRINRWEIEFTQSSSYSLFTIQITFPMDASLCSICYNTIFGSNQLSKHLFYTCLCLIFHFILKVQRMTRTLVFVMINSFLHIFSSFLIMDKYKVIQFTTHSILCFVLFQNPQKQYEVR